jgi:hypothetical protein
MYKKKCFKFIAYSFKIGIRVAQNEIYDKFNNQIIKMVYNPHLKFLIKIILAL